MGGIGGTGVIPESCQPGSSLCRDGSKPCGSTYGLQSSNTIMHQGRHGSCAPMLTNLHVTFAVHPIASYGWGGITNSIIIIMMASYYNTNKVKIFKRMSCVVECRLSFVDCVVRNYTAVWEDETCTGGTGVMPAHCQPGFSLCREDFKPPEQHTDDAFLCRYRPVATQKGTKAGVVNPCSRAWM